MTWPTVDDDPVVIDLVIVVTACVTEDPVVTDSLVVVAAGELDVVGLVLRRKSDKQVFKTWLFN